MNSTPPAYVPVPILWISDTISWGLNEAGETGQARQGRVDLCRRLTIETTDPTTADALSQMANEGEEDVQRLLAVAHAKLPQPTA